jgi:L,D-transpeptidase ErfK/SrfK
MLFFNLIVDIIFMTNLLTQIFPKKKSNRYLYQSVNRVLFFIGLCLIFNSCQALVLPLPHNEENTIGSMRIAQTRPGDTLYKLARRFEMGYTEMKNANPKLPKTRRIQSHNAIIIPAFFVLPNAPREGLLINLPEMRLYYFEDNRPEVITEPIAIGRFGWKTPEISSYILEKIKDPYWIVPESIKMHTLFEKDKVLPKFLPPGLSNPLGQYALRLGVWTILIHGTNDPSSVGKRISSGCIRLYPEDIELLYRIVKEGTPVHIVNQPYKVGWYQGNLYLEVHKPLSEVRDMQDIEQRKVHQLIMQAMQPYSIGIDWHQVAKSIYKHSGIPHRISL